MERDILHLYQQAQVGPLEAKEVHWLENQVNEFPYFALPRIILARHNFQKDQNVQSRKLLEGAAYSLDRGHFRNYMYMSLPAEAVEKEKDEASSKENTVEAKEKPAVTESKAAEPASKVVKPESKVADESKVAESGSKADDPNAVGKINWFLNTRLQIRTNRYLGQYGKIKGKLYSPDLLGNGQGDGDQAAPIEKEIPSAKEPEVVTEVPTAENASEKGKAASGNEVKAKPTKTEPQPKETKTTKAKTADSKESGGSPQTKEEKAKAVEALLASRREKSSKVAKEKKKEEDEKAADYEIGSFSSFSFVDEVDPGEGGEAEANSLVQAGEVVSLQTPEDPDGEYSELVIESNDRRLEVLVTPEELEKYFKGKLPAVSSTREHGLSATDDEPTHLQFNFSVSAAELEDDDDLNPSEEPGAGSRTEVQNLNAKSSPELISIAPVVETERDEEREQKLIDKFIEHEPSITRGGHVHTLSGDLAKESLKDEDDWVTETLAKVFVMQGNNARAIRIYKKLALLFPEKRAYFDVQISKLKR